MDYELYNQRKTKLNETFNSLNEEEKELYGWDIACLNLGNKSFDKDLEKAKNKIAKIREITKASKWNEIGYYEFNYETGYSKGTIKFNKGSLRNLKLSALNRLFKLVCEGK